MEKMEITNICTWYVSKWHLAAILLSFIANKIDKVTRVVTFLEDNLEEINQLAKELEVKKDVLDIKWTKINKTKYTAINKVFNENIGRKQIVIICGNINFIKNVKENVDIYYNKNKGELNKLIAEVKVISCYRVEEFNERIKEILDSNDKVLGVSGEKEKFEVYPDYYEMLGKMNKNYSRREKENDVFEEIRKYKQLYDEGAITEEEYSLKKKKLMDI